MKANASSIERFDGWFVKPIEKLKELPEGDGAFAAMMVALPLYERYINAQLKLNGKLTGEEDIRDEIAADLQLSNHQRSIFWDIFRVGFMHQGMAKAGKTKWMVSHTFGELPEFKTVDGHNYVCLDPWKFADRVLDKFRKDSRLITASDSFPLADVFYS
jgi:hypothetical protein